MLHPTSDSWNWPRSSEWGWGVGDVRNLLAGRIISAIPQVVLPETSLTPAIFVSNRHFRKKWASGKPSSQTSGYRLNTVSFLFGSCASCMNDIYLFIYNHRVQIFKFLSNLLYVETNGSHHGNFSV